MSAATQFLSLCSQDYSVEGMSESLLNFLQHLREFGLVFQRKVRALAELDFMGCVGEETQDWGNLGSCFGSEEEAELLSRDCPFGLRTV